MKKPLAPVWEKIPETDWFRAGNESPEVKEERLIWRTALEKTFDEPEYIEAVLDNVIRERLLRDDAKTPAKEVSASGTDTH